MTVDMAKLKENLQKVQPFTVREVKAALAVQGVEADAAECLNAVENFGSQIGWSSKGGWIFLGEEMS